MPVDQVVNILVTITLIQLMVTVGLGVTFTDVAHVAGNLGLVVRAATANYILVPAIATGCYCCFTRLRWSLLDFSWPPFVPGHPTGRRSPAWQKAMCRFRLV